MCSDEKPIRLIGTMLMTLWIFGLPFLSDIRHRWRVPVPSPVTGAYCAEKFKEQVAFSENDIETCPLKMRFVLYMLQESRRDDFKRASKWLNENKRSFQFVWWHFNIKNNEDGAAELGKQQMETFFQDWKERAEDNFYFKRNFYDFEISDFLSTERFMSPIIFVLFALMLFGAELDRSSKSPETENRQKALKCWHGTRFIVVSTAAIGLSALGVLGNFSGDVFTDLTDGKYDQAWQFFGHEQRLIWHKLAAVTGCMGLLCLNGLDMIELIAVLMGHLRRQRVYGRKTGRAMLNVVLATAFTVFMLVGTFQTSYDFVMMGNEYFEWISAVMCWGLYVVMPWVREGVAKHVSDVRTQNAELTFSEDPIAFGDEKGGPPAFLELETQAPKPNGQRPGLLVGSLQDLFDDLCTDFSSYSWWLQPSGFCKFCPRRNFVLILVVAVISLIAVREFWRKQIIKAQTPSYI